MDLEVDRLTLSLPGLSEADARRLPDLVAECLAGAQTSGLTRRAGRLRLTVTDRAEPLASMARRIADEILGALARSS